MTFYNRTRTSGSIPQRLRRDGRWYLLPLYWLLVTSDLASEAVAGSGSWRFADHIYLGRAHGRYGIGTVVDWILLRLAPARAFRTRYAFARDHAAAMIARAASPISILSVPCGVPRDLIEAVGSAGAGAVTVYGIDLDPVPIEAARREIAARGIRAPFRFIEADALDPLAYPQDVDLVISTGFGEFLDDDMLHEFLLRCRDALAPGGTLLITATGHHRLGEFLLEVAELRAHYRSPEEIKDRVRAAGFSLVSAERDPSGLQAHVVARKEAM